MNARTDPTATLAPTDGSTFVDADGRTWSVRKVTSFAADTSDSTPSFHATSYPTKSDDQIADDFRAVRLKLGADGDAWEYTEVYPPTARVTAALAKDRAGVSGYGTIGPNGEHTYVEEAPATSAMQPIRPGDYGAIGSDDAIRRPVATRQFSVERWTSRRAPASVGRTPFTELTPTSEQGTEVLPDLQEAAPRNVIGNEDDRVWMTHEGIASSQGKVEISLSSDPYPGVPGSHCSAHPIGRATAISAAHCFWPRYSNMWANPKDWAVGVVRSNSDLGYRETILYGPWYRCYWVTIPSAWTTQFDAADDWAVIDFENTGCNIAWPGDVVGWTGFWVDADPTATIDAPTYLNAYDVDSPQPQQPLNTSYLAPSLIVRSEGPWSTAIYSGSGGTELATTIDLTGGASGGGLLQPVNPYTTDPVFVGAIEGEDAASNYARRLDNNIWAFTQDNCAEW